MNVPSFILLHFQPLVKGRKDESAYGACTAILQYAADGSVAKCVLIDTAMAKTADVVIADLKAQGVKQIDALFMFYPTPFSAPCKSIAGRH